MLAIRPAAVAGMFYPDDPIELKQTVTDLLAKAGAAESVRAPKALIVPHAGYIYSGPIAASASHAAHRTLGFGSCRAFARLGVASAAFGPMDANASAT